MHSNAVNRCLCTNIAALPALRWQCEPARHASQRRLAAAARPRPETCLEPRREAMQRSQTSSSPCPCRLDLSSPRRARAAMKSGDRDLKRGIRVCGFGLERLPWPGDGLFASACLDCYLARSRRQYRIEFADPPEPDNGGGAFFGRAELSSEPQYSGVSRERFVSNSQE